MFCSACEALSASARFSASERPRALSSALVCTASLGLGLGLGLGLVLGLGLG